MWNFVNSQYGSRPGTPCYLFIINSIVKNIFYVDIIVFHVGLSKSAIRVRDVLYRVEKKAGCRMLNI